MKTIFFMCLLLGFFGYYSNAATISGTISNGSTSTIITNQMVYCIDSNSLTLFKDSTFTDSLGSYSFTIPSAFINGTIRIHIVACGFNYDSISYYFGTNLIQNRIICSSSASMLSGKVLDMATSAPISGITLYYNDSISATSTYSDSTVTNASGIYSFPIPAFTRPYESIKVSIPFGGTNITQYVTNLGTNRSLNFLICSATAPPKFSGILYLPSGAAASGIVVQLFQLGSPSMIGAATTTSSGAFSINIPCNTNINSTLYLKINSKFECGVVDHHYGTNNFTGPNIMIYDTLNGANCPYSLSGKVVKQNAGIGSDAKVWLLSENIDTTVIPNLHILTAIDSTVTDVFGRYRFGRNTLPASNTNQYVRIKAALQMGDPSYSNYLPSYADSAIFWNISDTAFNSLWIANYYNFNISLRHGSNSVGSGFIGGNVLVGANKTTNVGDPIPNSILILLNSLGSPIAYTYSGIGGAFSFPNLAYGTYKILGDAMGKNNPALTITITSLKPTIYNIIFEENDTKFVGRFGNTGLNPVSNPLNAIMVFPNPVTNYLQINNLMGIPGSKTIVLSNITGQVLYQKNIASGENASIILNDFPSGMFLLQVKTSIGSANYKVIK